jgi:hypothetical protein
MTQYPSKPRLEACESADPESENPRADEPLRVGAPVRVPRLDEPAAIRAELARLYREARRRHGRYPDAMTAQRLANVLAAVRQALEIEELARRLAALEVRLKEKRQ